MKKILKRIMVILCAAILLLWGIEAVQMRVCRARICFDDYGESVHATLTAEETQTVKEILRTRTRMASDTCGYSRNICITIGLNRFELANDGCNGIFYNMIYYYISKEDMDKLHDIFTKYGVEWWSY